MLIVFDGGHAPCEDSGERVSEQSFAFTSVGAASPPLEAQIVGSNGSSKYIFQVHVSAGVCA